MTGSAYVRVVKVGGSLFDLPTLPDRLARWFAKQTPASNVVIAGGGTMADAIRYADRVFRLDPATTHWISVGVMTATAKLVAALLPNAWMVLRFEDLQKQLSFGEPRLIVFAVEDFLKKQETEQVTRLPCDGTVTSDSIAAHLAMAIAAEELVLLKSASASPDTNREKAAKLGLTDEYFPVASKSLANVRWVNLRDESTDEVLLT